MMNTKFTRQMVSLRENPPHIKRSPLEVMVITDERTIRTSRGKALYKSPFLAHQLSVFFDQQEQGGQDHVFKFRDGLENYKAHYDLSWFSPLLRGNCPTSNGLMLKMNRGYNGVSRGLKKFMW
jgi:hypothetical protein